MTGLLVNGCTLLTFAGGPEAGRVSYSNYNVLNVFNFFLDGFLVPGYICFEHVQHSKEGRSQHDNRQ
jgi:hypothetical protein